MSDKQYFVGSRKVKTFHVSAGTNLVGVLYEDGYNEDFTAEQWEGVRSETAYDDGMISINKYEKLCQRIIKELVNARVDLKAHEWILERVSQSIGENYRLAIAKVFGTKKPEDIMLAQIDMTLKQ
jgi:hypothetical protein